MRLTHPAEHSSLESLARGGGHAPSLRQGSIQGKDEVPAFRLCLLGRWRELSALLPVMTLLCSPALLFFALVPLNICFSFILAETQLLSTA